MTEGVLISIVGALAASYAATIAVVVPLLVSSRKHAKNAAVSSAQANEQVTNDHTTNLRDDNDKQHADVMRLLRSHGRTLGRQGRRLERLEHVNGITTPLPRTRKKTP